MTVLGQTAAWDTTFPTLCSYTDTATATQISNLQSGPNPSISAATNASPIQITSASHGLVTGQTVTITGVTGNTAANGTWTTTRVDANNFTLNGSTGSGAYVAGGAWVAAVYVPAVIPPELLLPFDTVYAPPVF